MNESLDLILFSLMIIESCIREPIQESNLSFQPNWCLCAFLAVVSPLGLYVFSAKMSNSGFFLAHVGLSFFFFTFNCEIVLKIIFLMVLNHVLKSYPKTLKGQPCTRRKFSVGSLRFQTEEIHYIKYILIVKGFLFWVWVY